MKKRVLIYLFWIATALFVFSCKSDEPNMDLIHEDIAGEWTFSNPSFSGEFKIVKSINNEFVVDKGAVIKINGKSYVSRNYIEIYSESGLELDDFEFYADDLEFELSGLSYSSDYLKIISEYQDVKIGNQPEEYFEEMVTITRK